jgi:phosphopantothenoylcysteine decarboxylase/phosphopantothenate--cysteine ligase
MTKLSIGKAEDLATTVLLASNKDILLVPAMNVRMWLHKATQRNLKILQDYGYHFIGPEKGEMACGEFGYGKMALVKEISKEINFVLKPGPLVGRKALVTSGPTIESIDPIRFISNRSSGKQGHAIARMLGNYGAETTLISGPVNLENPTNVEVKNVNTAEEMFAACKDSLQI